MILSGGRINLPVSQLWFRWCKQSAMSWRHSEIAGWGTVDKRCRS